MIGYKIYKDNMENYSEVALWCNENNAIIEEHDTYYEVVPVTPIVYEVDKEAELLHKLETIKNAYMGAVLMGTDTEQLATEYKDTVAQLTKLQEENRKE